jgi:hypothetical protein
MAYNPNNANGQGTMANSTPVVLASNQSTVPVSAASLPLPTGASTSAKQPALGVAGTASVDVITVQGKAGMTPVLIDGTATTQPVSAAALPLPTGAATLAKQPALGTAGTPSADVITVQGVASMTAFKVDGSAVTQPVSGTFFQGTQPVSLAALPALVAGAALVGKFGIDQTTAGTTNAVSLAQLGAITVAVNNGVAGAGVQRVVLASDQTPFTLNISATGAAADGVANATVLSRVNAQNSNFNGTNWDRQRGNADIATGDTGAHTTTFNGAGQTNYNARGAYITLIVGTVSGTTPSMVPTLQWSPDGGTTWVNFGPAMTAITASGNYTFAVYPTNLSQAAGATPANLSTGATQTVLINTILPRTWRVVYTIIGTTPSFTLTGVWANYVN